MADIDNVLNRLQNNYDISTSEGIIFIYIRYEDKIVAVDYWSNNRLIRGCFKLIENENKNSYRYEKFSDSSKIQRLSDNEVYDLIAKYFNEE